MMNGFFGASSMVLAAAEAAGKAAAGKAAAPTAAPPGLGDMLPMMLALAAIFYFIYIRPQRGKEKQIREQLSQLKEKDRVVTIGGIHGVVTNVQRDADLVTIRVDESTGTKIKFGTSAIARVVVEEAAAE